MEIDQEVKERWRQLVLEVGSYEDGEELQMDRRLESLQITWDGGELVGFVVSSGEISTLVHPSEDVPYYESWASLEQELRSAAAGIRLNPVGTVLFQITTTLTV